MLFTNTHLQRSSSRGVSLRALPTCRPSDTYSTLARTPPKENTSSFSLACYIRRITRVCLQFSAYHLHRYEQCVRGRPFFVVVVRFRCLVDINTDNRSQNTVGHTRFFDLRAKGVDKLVQTFFLLIDCGELMTETLYNFLEVRYLFL